MQRTATFLIAFCISSVAAPAVAQEAVPLDAFYQRTAEDLRSGLPIVVVANYGMWQHRPDEPEKNLNWGVYYGHATMMKRARKDGHIRKNYRYHDYRLVFQREQKVDPIRTLIFETEVKPNARWKEHGVTEPIRAYLVMHAWQDQQEAALAALSNIRQSSGEKVTLDNGVELHTGAAQAAGYFGHNFFYDYEGFSWDGFSAVQGAPTRPKGAFAVGCKTGRVPGFNDWIGENVHVLLFSRTLMASEGYSTLALMNGILSHYDGKELVQHADATYQYFQKLGDPDRRVGSPFVSHDYRLFD